MYEEGDIADGPNGQQLVFRGGQWVPMSAPTLTPMTIGQRNPYALPKDAVDLEKATQDARRAAAMAPVEQATAEAQLENLRNPRAAPPSGYRYKVNGDLEPIPGGPVVGQAGVKKGNGSLDALVAQINDYSGKYAGSVGATSGFGGLRDYLPSDSNAALDKSAALLEDIAIGAFKVPGMGAVSDADAARMAAATKPDRWDRDAATRETLAGLRRRVDSARAAAGLPAAVWEPDQRKTVATGATKTVADASKTPAVAALQALLRGGASDDQIRGAAAALDASPGSVDAALSFRRKNPSYKGAYNLGDLGTREEATTLRERMSGTPAAAFFASAANDAAAGIPGAVFGTDNLKVQQAAFPGASTAGSLVGGVAGASALELGLANGAARLGGGLASRLLANPATADAVYGGIQGATTSGTPEGAAIGLGAGVAGGMFGRGAVRGAAGAFRGVTDPGVRYLADRGVPLTVGQTLGGVAKGVEDRLSGVPIVGDVVRSRRLEGLREFNRTAFDQGLTNIGASTGGTIGEKGIDLARGARSQAYRAALDPVRLTPDAQFGSDLAAARQQASLLPADMAERGRYALDRAVENGPTGLDGNGFQQALRRFRRTSSENAPLPNGNDLGDVMRAAEGAYTGLLSRQAPAALAPFNAANAANRNVEVLRDAVNKARNGTRTGETGVFAPSQLSDAAAANARKFGNTAGTTQQPFFDLTRAGQAVLPSQVPDSGTAGRLALLGLPAVLGGAGAGAGYAGGDTSTGAYTGLGLGAALTLGGGRAAQRLATQALLDRPDALIRIGEGLYNRRRLGGMFGAGFGATGASLLGSDF